MWIRCQNLRKSRNETKSHVWRKCSLPTHSDSPERRPGNSFKFPQIMVQRALSQFPSALRTDRDMLSYRVGAETTAHFYLTAIFSHNKHSLTNQRQPRLWHMVEPLFGASSHGFCIEFVRTHTHSSREYGWKRNRSIFIPAKCKMWGSKPAARPTKVYGYHFEP